jgi:hypothetical protein
MAGIPPTGSDLVLRADANGTDHGYRSGRNRFFIVELSYVYIITAITPRAITAMGFSKLL